MPIKVSLDSIRAVRARVERSVPECRLALEESNGDVDAAVESLQTPLEAAAERSARMYSKLPNATLETRRAAPPPPAREIGHAQVIADFADAIAARKLRTGEPDPAALARLQADVDELPAALVALLARWNGIEISASMYIWPCGRNRDVIDSDEPACEDAFVFGEHLDMGYAFLHAGEVWFYDYSDGRPPCRLSPNFESFLRDLLNTDFDVIGLVERAYD